MSSNSSEQFSITRRIEIDAAHRVPHHGSKCFKVHGHMYVIEATCSGEVIEEGEQTGMVMDFGFLKQCMIQVIHAPCDHAIILWKNDPMLESMPKPPIGVLQVSNPEPWWKIEFTEEVPTAENLAKMWHGELCHAIFGWFDQFEDVLESKYPKLVQVKVWETPNCSAVYPHG